MTSNMGRRNLRKHKLSNTKELLKLSERIVKLDASYNKVREQMAEFSGDDPRRSPLEETAKRLYLQKERLSALFSATTAALTENKAIGDANRKFTEMYGKANKGVNRTHSHLESARLHST
jgi:predicted nuclease with TOPRIM domain